VPLPHSILQLPGWWTGGHWTLVPGGRNGQPPARQLSHRSSASWFSSPTATSAGRPAGSKLLAVRTRTYKLAAVSSRCIRIRATARGRRRFAKKTNPGTSEFWTLETSSCSPSRGFHVSRHLSSSGGAAFRRRHPCCQPSKVVTLVSSLMTTASEEDDDTPSLSLGV
jgi:hypothetical protein